MPETCNYHNVENCPLCENRKDLTNHITQKSELSILINKSKVLDQLLYNACSNGEVDGIMVFDIDLHCAVATIEATRLFNESGTREGYNILSLRIKRP